MREEKPMSLDTENPSFQRGVEMRRKLMGEAGVERLITGAVDDFQAPLENFVTKAVFGDAWTSDDLQVRERLLVTLGIVAGLGKEIPTRRLTRLCITNGVTKQEIRGVLTQVIAYAGVGSGVEAWEWATQTLKELGEY
jgi:4-carboxymuconolactone decarboxylase